MPPSEQQTASPSVFTVEAGRTHAILQRTLHDLSEEEVQRIPAAGLSPIIWQIGHIAASDAFFARLAGQTFAPDAAFEALFGRKTGGPKAYPALPQVLAVYNNAQAAIEAAVAAGKFETTLGDDGFKTVGDALSFGFFHRGYHIGKIMTLRAMLGKPRLFE